MKAINLPKLIITVFIISWIGVLPSLLIAHKVAIPEWLKYFDILMTIGPISGAIIFLYRSGAKEALKQFFKRLTHIKASAIVFLVAVLSPIIISYLASQIGFSLSADSWPSSFDAATIVTNGLLISLAYLVINTEELVWRGLVFDQLLDKHGFIRSCLIIAPIWWLFHIPLFLFPDGHQAGYGLLEFTLIVIAETIILGWIYTRSNRSLFYVHMHHQLMNGFGQAFPIFPVFIAGNLLPLSVFCVLLIATAVLLIVLHFREIAPEKSKD